SDPAQSDPAQSDPTQPDPTQSDSTQSGRGGVQPAAQQASGGLSLVDVRRLWPDIVEATKTRRRVTWIHLTQHAQVVAVDATTLTLGFANAGARDSFVGGGSADVVRQAAIDVVGTDWRIDAVVDPGASPGSAVAPGFASPSATSRSRMPSPSAAPEAGFGSDAEAPEWATEAASAREAILQTRAPGAPADRTDGAAALADAEARRDDPDAETSELTGAELLRRELGAEIIEERKK
ncbi:MAG: DNA polymerase III subunit gamma/tau, partial [Nocardioides sp.]